MTPVADTTNDAERKHLQVLARLGPARRLQMAFDLSVSLRLLSEAGVRRRHPSYDERMVRLAATRLSIGDELFRQAFPGAQVEL